MGTAAVNLCMYLLLQLTSSYTISPLRITHLTKPVVTPRSTHTHGGGGGGPHVQGPASSFAAVPPIWLELRNLFFRLLPERVSLTPGLALARVKDFEVCILPIAGITS